MKKSIYLLFIMLSISFIFGCSLQPTLTEDKAVKGIDNSPEIQNFVSSHIIYIQFDTGELSKFQYLMNTEALYKKLQSKGLIDLTEPADPNGNYIVTVTDKGRKVFKDNKGPYGEVGTVKFQGISNLKQSIGKKATVQATYKVVPTSELGDFYTDSLKNVLRFSGVEKMNQIIKLNINLELYKDGWGVAGIRETRS